MQVRELIATLEEIGKVYRSKDGLKPAQSLKNVIAQLKGHEDTTLRDWISERATKSPSSEAKPEEALNKIDFSVVISSLEKIRTHEDLRSEIEKYQITAENWRDLSKKITGVKGSSGSAAKNKIERYYSDRLLQKERIEAVKAL